MEQCCLDCGHKNTVCKEMCDVYKAEVGCEYCKFSTDFKIKEAYHREENVHTQIYVEESHIGIHLNDGRKIDGFYIDINYCPMCGRKL